MTNKNKVTIAIELLVIELIIVKLLLGGLSANNFENTVLPQVVFFSLITIIMMLVPFVLKLLNKERFSYKEGITICAYNSIFIYIVAMLHPVITLIVGNDVNFKSFNILTSAANLMLLYTITAVLFFTINMLLFTESKVVIKDSKKSNKKKTKKNK